MLARISPATRYVRKKLIEFAKNQPEAPPFQLRYNKLVINRRQYTYDTATESVIRLASDHTPDNQQPSLPTRGLR